MQLSPTSSSAKYYMEFDKHLNILYISLPFEKVVVKIATLDPSEEDSENAIFLRSNFKVIAGEMNKPCRDLGRRTNNCGDGNLATKSRLAFPKVSE